MSLSRISSFCCVLVLLSASGCSRYSVSVNENVVYEPAQLFNDYSIDDVALRKCVRGTIAENGLTQAEQLTHLLCPPGDIQSLAGLEAFKHIQYLGLGRNELVNIESIGTLMALRHVDVSHNTLVDFSVLVKLPQLELVKAVGNSKADCHSLTLNQENIRVDRPKHCR